MTSPRLRCPYGRRRATALRQRHSWVRQTPVPSGQGANTPSPSTFTCLPDLETIRRVPDDDFATGTGTTTWWRTESECSDTP